MKRPSYRLGWLLVVLCACDASGDGDDAGSHDGDSALGGSRPDASASLDADTELDAAMLSDSGSPAEPSVDAAVLLDAVAPIEDAGSDAGTDSGGDAGTDGGLPTEPDCCPALTSCLPFTPACPLLCPDGTECDADALCAQSPNGDYACASTCAAERTCGSLCCPLGAACDTGACAKGDLMIDLGDPSLALTFGHREFTEDSCALTEGCVLASGRRSVFEFSFTVHNVGDAPIVLGDPGESDLYQPNFCEGAYVIPWMFLVDVRDGTGTLVAQGYLATSCVAGEGGSYDCFAQGLGPAESAAQPVVKCDFLDVTDLAAGDYTLTITVNPIHLIAESDFDNNSAEIAIDYLDCDGTVCGGACCPQDVPCIDDICMLPDLRIHEQAAVSSIRLEYDTFGVNSCEIEEMCVSGSGRRRLLKFEGRIENLGPGDLNPGPEAGNPLFEFSECHGHYHFIDFTDYRLLNLDGSVAAQGHKQSFCLVDMVPVDDPTVPAPPGTHPDPGPQGCSYLSAGWADIYGVGTPCQWVDVTGVPPGDYLLSLSVNPLGRVIEASTSNNDVVIPIEIPEEVVRTTRNDSCDLAYDLTEPATYESLIRSADVSEISPSCGGLGGEAFFRFTLDAAAVVYLGALDSTLDTVLALHQDDCAGSELHCVDDTCGEANGQLVEVLEAGTYLVVVKARDAGMAGRVRLKYQHAPASGAQIVSEPGVYAGNTGGSDDSVGGCGAAPPVGDDAGADEDGGGVPGLGAPDDVYAFAACAGVVTASTCGSSDHDSLLQIRRDALDGPMLACSASSNLCSGDADGATVSTDVSPGLVFVVVEGETPDAAGAYQLSLTY